MVLNLQRRHMGIHQNTNHDTWLSVAIEFDFAPRVSIEPA